jgi:biotin carboxylase
MSEILVVHRIPYQVTPLDDWIAEVADRVTLVTAEETRSQYEGLFPRVIGVPRYTEGPQVEQELNRICAQRPISTLVHVTEDDVLRAARVRDRFDLPGPRTADVLPWRDKYSMKRRVSAAGVATAEFAVPADAADAQAFAERNGYPVVVKPRLGFASHGVTVARDASRLTELAQVWDTDDVLLESFVPGEVYHVDGFAQDGKVLHVSVSRYLNGCLAFQDGKPLGSVQLDRDDESWPAFAELAEQVVKAMPELDFCPYHLEVFRRPDGELVFCEIACRLGGAHIMESFTHATGVNPARLWIRHQVGLQDGPAVPIPTEPAPPGCPALVPPAAQPSSLPARAASPRARSDGKRYGWLLIPPKAGRLVEIRQPEGVDFITDFVVKTAVPRDFDGAHGSTDSIIGYVVSGTDSMDVETNLRKCIDLTEHLARWEPLR